MIRRAAKAADRLSAWENFRRLAPWVRPYRAGIIVMFVTDILALIATTITPFVIARMINGPIMSGDRDGLWRYAAILVGLAIVQTILFALRRLPTPKMADVETTIRRRLYFVVQRLSALYHDRQGSGTILARLNGDIGQIGLGLQMTFVWLVSNAVSLALTAAMLIAIHPLLGSAVVVAMIPLGLASTVFQNRFRTAASTARDRAGEVATSAEESALAIRVLRSLGGGPFVIDRFGNAARASRDAELEKIRLNSIFGAFLAGYPMVILVGVIVAGGIAVSRDSITLGAFVAFTTFYFRMLGPVNHMGGILSSFQEAINALQRVFDLIDTEAEIVEIANPQRLPDGPLGVQFSAVKFSFPESGEVLDGVDLLVRPGETLALVGATGSGKSVLGALVPRLMDVTAGSVRVGEVDVREAALTELRSAIGMAFEDAMLFSVSVRENLTLGREITEAEIEQALAVTQSGFVKGLPDGLDTVVGEQGLTLSGGQRQRLALARALLGHPRVLVLDDPMSALDVRTEEALERDLRAAFGNVTTIIVARRPSTAMLADRVAVLDQGRIVASGTHDDLLRDSATYRRVMIAADSEEVAHA